MTRRLAILQQFDPHGGVPGYVREHIKGLRKVASRIVLVSNSPIHEADRRATEVLCDEIVERENAGWDFAGWRDALRREDMAAWDQVILTNSSVVGPLYPLAPVFEKMEQRSLDFWGMVLSRQIREHLQSYFFVFSSRVVQSREWDGFWASVTDIDDKDKVIALYEAGLTLALAKGGFTYGAFMPDPPLLDRIRMVELERLGIGARIPFDMTRVNRTVRWHDELIEQGFPYLKASLLWGKDTARLRNFDRIRALTAEHYDWSAVEQDMHR